MTLTEIMNLKQLERMTRCLEALRALTALRDRPHGFRDPEWYEDAFDEGREALTSFDS